MKLIILLNNGIKSGIYKVYFHSQCVECRRKQSKCNELKCLTCQRCLIPQSTFTGLYICTQPVLQCVSL